MTHDWQITNATVVLPDEIRKNSGCVISANGLLERVLAPGESEPDLLSVDLHGALLFPGLINSHDSLLATFHKPAALSGQPYANWLSWDNDLKSSPEFQERMLLEAEQLYHLGDYRNLTSGVTTALDHVPHFVRQAGTDMAVSLPGDFGISHSICSYSLDWGDGVAAEYEKARSQKSAYITHIAEGFDDESRQSLDHLASLGGLGEHTVLVHGLALSDSDLDRIASAGASLVWCPTMSADLYEKTTPVAAALERGINVALGTDSAMTGSTNLLDELRRAAGLLEASTGTAPEPRLLFEMAVTNGARALRLPDRGAITEGLRADLLVLSTELSNKHASDPFAALLDARPGDIFLAVGNGRPLMGDVAMETLFTELGRPFDRVAMDGKQKIIRHGLKKLLETIRDTLGYSKGFHFLPVGD